MPDPIELTSPGPPRTSPPTGASRPIALSESKLAAIVEAAYLREITKR